MKPYVRYVCPRCKREVWARGADEVGHWCPFDHGHYLEMVAQ